MLCIYVLTCDAEEKRSVKGKRNRERDVSENKNLLCYAQHTSLLPASLSPHNIRALRGHRGAWLDGRKACPATTFRAGEGSADRICGGKDALFGKRAPLIKDRHLAKLYAGHNTQSYRYLPAYEGFVLFRVVTRKRTQTNLPGRFTIARCYVCCLITE